DLAVRRFEEAVLVQSSVQRHRVDQTDVRAFRRFDRAHTTVVRGMHVTHFEAGTFAGQTARAKCRHAALVGDFRQRIGLVHELRQLARTEELLDCRRNGLGVDQVVRHQVFGFGLAQALLDGALDTHEPGAELIFSQFANATHATVAEVVDVVDLTTAITQLDQHLDGFKDVVVGERERAVIVFAATQAAVDLHAANAREVVGFFAVEETLEQCLDGVFGGRLTRAHHAVDGHAGGVLVSGLVGAQGGRDVAAAVEIVDVQGLNFADVGCADVGQNAFGDLVVGVGDHFARFRVDDVLGQYAADEIVFGHRDAPHAGVGKVAQMLGIDALVFLDDDLAVAIGDIEAGHFALPALGHELEHAAFGMHFDLVEVKEGGQDRFRRHADGLQQDRDRHLAATVDTEEEYVFRVELEIKPGAAVGNDACREQQLAGAVGLATVVLEEHAGGTVQLRNNDALGTVDDEGTVFGHERNFAHVHFLFLDFANGGPAGFSVHQHQAHLGAQGRGVGQAALLAFLDVEYRIAQGIADKLESSHAIVAHNRENGI